MRNHLVVFLLFATVVAINSQTPPGGGETTGAVSGGSTGTTSTTTTSGTTGSPTTGGSGGGYGSDWQVLAVELDGHNSYYNWVYHNEAPGYAEYNFSIDWDEGAMPANASNNTHYNLAPRMESEGTITVRLKYIGSGPVPSHVWIKVNSAAGYGPSMSFEPPPMTSGDADDGIGDPVVYVGGGGISTGEEYYKVPVAEENGEHIAEKSIVLEAYGTYSAPYASVSSWCSAMAVSPDALSYKGKEMEFTNVVGNIINQNTTFGSTQGSAFPVNGWHMPETIGYAYPVHYKKGLALNTSYEYRAAVDWAEPTPSVLYKIEGTMGALSEQWTWPEQSGTASEDFVTKAFVSDLTLHDKIYMFTYLIDWVITPEEPFNITTFPTGAHTVYVAWDNPKGGEVVTLKRLNWVVTSANGSETEVEAADSIWEDIPIGKFGHTNVVPFGQEWRLMDANDNVKGECDEFARLMKKMMNLVGIDASTSAIYASTDAAVESPESMIFNGNLYWLVMDFGNEYWNAFEGVCLTAGKCYAVAPKKDASCVEELFETLPFTQYWCRTNQDITPGHTHASGAYWLPIQSYLTPAVPKPDIFP